MQVLTKSLERHYENPLSFKFFKITIIEASMMPVEKLWGEAELVRDTTDTKIFLHLWQPARICSDTSDNLLPEEQSAVSWLPPWWEVRSKRSCDALTAVVDASKLMLDRSF